MWYVLASSLALAAAPAQTNTVAVTIMNGDLSRAEALLLADRTASAQEPEALLNMAAIYASTQRAAEAATLYERVLASEPVLLDLADGSSFSSHDIAYRGLSRVRPRLTSR